MSRNTANEAGGGVRHAEAWHGRNRANSRRRDSVRSAQSRSSRWSPLRDREDPILKAVVPIGIKIYLRARNLRCEIAAR